MKKIFTSVIFTASLTLAVNSCVKSAKELPAPDENEETIEIRVNGVMGEYAVEQDATKARLVNNIRASWDGNGTENVYVYDGTRCLGSLGVTLQDESDDRYALLSTDGCKHTVKKPAPGTKRLTLIHTNIQTDGHDTAPAVSNGEISISLAEQTYYTAFVIYATLAYNGEEYINITNAAVPFEFATSVIRVNCIGLNPQQQVADAKINNINTICKFKLSGDSAPEVSGEGLGVISKDMGAVATNEEGECAFQMAVPLISSGTHSMTVKQIDDEREIYTFVDEPFDQSASDCGKVINIVRKYKQWTFPGVLLPGAFSIFDKKIYFSKGNLQAVSNGADYEWRFAPNQYDYVGKHPGNTRIDSHRKGEVVDLFGWSTESNYFGISSSRDTLDYQGPLMDWGEALNDGWTWYTLSPEDWYELLNVREVKGDSGEGYSYTNKSGGITIEGQTYKGLFLYPDDYFRAEIGKPGAPDTWKEITESGIVFLPCAGLRDGNSITNETDGLYWANNSGSQCLRFNDEVTPFFNTNNYFGHSVRLVSEFSVGIRNMIVFDVQGHGIAPAPVIVPKNGTRITTPPVPEAEGFTFAGWYKEPSCKEIWNFNEPIEKTEETTILYAKWIAGDKPPVPKGFMDIGATSPLGGTPIYWAENNLGASEPTQSGTYYAWGAVEKVYDYIYEVRDTVYTDSTSRKYDYIIISHRAKFMNDNPDTKRYTGEWNPSQGFAPCNMPLADEEFPSGYLSAKDDAVSVYYNSRGEGGWPNYRIPTKVEYEFLMENCVWIYEKNYNNSNVSGFVFYKPKNIKDAGKVYLPDGRYYKYRGRQWGYCSREFINLYSKNDTHIFLPFAGYFEGNGLDEAKLFYWTNINITAYDWADAISRLEETSLPTIDGKPKYLGAPIRGVYDPFGNEPY